MSKFVIRLWAKRPLFALAAGLVALMALDHFSPGFLWLGGLVFAAVAFRFGGWKSALTGVCIAAIVLVGGRLRDARQEADEARFSKIGLAEVEARLSRAEAYAFRYRESRDPHPHVEPELLATIEASFAIEEKEWEVEQLRTAAEEEELRAEQDAELMQVAGGGGARGEKVYRGELARLQAGLAARAATGAQGGARDLSTARGASSSTCSERRLVGLQRQDESPWQQWQLALREHAQVHRTCSPRPRGRTIW